MKSDVFSFKDYRKYLLILIELKPKAGRGFRVILAQSIGVQVSHISQVLAGKSNFTLEQAEAVNQAVGHSTLESDFFLLLVQHERAGTPALRERVQRQIREIKDKRENLKERLGVEASVAPADQAQFYSSWLYGAIHVALTIESLQTKEALSRHFGISLKKVTEILEFLVTIGLAKLEGNARFEVGQSRIHLAVDSPMISKFHTNWRMRAIHAFDDEAFRKNLHYSSVVSMSEEDFEKIRELHAQHIEKIKGIIRDSPAESLHCFSMDFFKLQE